MIYDTDIFILLQNGNKKASKLIDNDPQRFLSVITYLEFLQGSRNRTEMKRNKDFLLDLNFQMIPLSDKIGHQACFYIEHFTLSHGTRTNDALIAATAYQEDQPLCTANGKHFKHIPNLKLQTLTL